jgi:hypothetical protein
MSGVTTAAETAATVALGPTTSCFEVPKSGYTSSAANAAYSPYCTGTPTIVAYARLCGTRSAQTDSPARASATSHLRS